MNSDENKSKEGLSPLTDIFFEKDGKLTKQGALIIAATSVAIAMAIIKHLFRK